MRSPRAFMARSSWVVTGLVSSAIGSRPRRQRGVELRQLPQPEGAVRKLGMWQYEVRLTQHPIAEAHDVQVQSPRSPADPRPALAAPLRFDRVQLDEKVGGLEGGLEEEDRKSTRLNSSHSQISYAVFCLKKKKKEKKKRLLHNNNNKSC